METKTIEIGRHSVEFTEEKLHALFKINEYAMFNDMQRDLSHLIDILIKADEQDAIDEDVTSWLYMLVDIKNHYATLAQLGITDTTEGKEAGNEQE